jgi:Fe-S-cluster containining protein
MQIPDTSILQKLKRLKPKDLDQQFQRFHDEVFDRTDCLSCANCCKTTSPIFRPADIERLAKHLRMKPSELIEQYLTIDEDGDYVLRTAPCPFLDAENYCTVYAHRPTACREYPHTDRKRMHQILDLTARNAAICPAVAQIVEKIAAHYGS